jgi:hypothetical protein
MPMVEFYSRMGFGALAESMRKCGGFALGGQPVLKYVRPFHEPTRDKQPLSPALSPLLRRGAREKEAVPTVQELNARMIVRGILTLALPGRG